ncbi:unnamed protein product (macronuclear) [Paramecium tetraurelia]|uniref:3'-5' exonuclease domain-containing protein n=1 Tax=Paramecium tetraurelia TaxID=5888 RepID=A0CQJ2_PARTE|nr:uncharacterized protein GSPATT00009407001 [Paramecium tetraurelia]CAK73059.1 unnamed protein product [Paramecium tetraurelia]|eukprot:XP_001440456.1 hypothetical protein (macronuclear) [Paramecium tetraurelia strain d4-2]
MQEQLEDIQVLQKLYSAQGNTPEEIITNFKNQQKQHLSKLFKYISNENELNQFQLKGSIIGVDIEHTNDIGFDGQISIVQIKDDEDVYIIDVIEIGVDNQKLINVFKQIFEDDKIIKVFYAGSTDVLWLKRDFQITIQNFFDIKEVADECKLSKISLIFLWKQYCDHQVSKSYKTNMQTSDWAERPLTQEQLIYAAYDCYYLPYLRYVLLEELSKADIKKQSKIQKKFEKAILKDYKKPILSNQDLAKIIDKEYNLLMQIVAENDDKSPIYSFLKTQPVAVQLVKFIALEIMKIRQDYAIHHNDPVECLEENEQVILIAIHIYQRLNIQDIQVYKLTYPDFQNYSNKQFELTLEYIQKQIDQDWEVYFKSFCKGLYQSFIFDQNFIKFGLTAIFEALQMSPEPKNNQSQQKMDQKKQKQTEFVEKYTRKKPAYGNCKIYTKENFFLCNCDEKKVRWYLKQGLADLISEDPPTIQLKFDPSGFKEEGSDKAQYVTIERVNQCVICGKENELLKFHIVPVVYKKHIQGKRSYDVVCLCLTCHHKASALNDKLKATIAEKYNINVKQNKKETLPDMVKNLIKAVQAYNKKKQNLPKEAYQKFQMQFNKQIEQLKSQELFKQINQFDLNNLKYEENLININDEQFLAFISYLKQNEELFNQNDDNSDQGKLIVEQLKTEEEIDEFLVFWRDNFLNEMKPQYLNEAWAIDHKFKRTFGDKSQYNPNYQKQEKQIDDQD